jgi:hypothetical protein
LERLLPSAVVQEDKTRQELPEDVVAAADTIVATIPSAVSEAREATVDLRAATAAAAAAAWVEVHRLGQEERVSCGTTARQFPWVAVVVVVQQTPQVEVQPSAVERAETAVAFHLA